MYYLRSVILPVSIRHKNSSIPATSSRKLYYWLTMLLMQKEYICISLISPNHLEGRLVGYLNVHQTSALYSDRDHKNGSSLFALDLIHLRYFILQVRSVYHQHPLVAPHQDTTWTFLPSSVCPDSLRPQGVRRGFPSKMHSWLARSV